MVSLIVPCYNGKQFLNRCIDCILNQTYKDIELILVNDGSTDGSNEIILERKNEIENTITKFIYINQPNQGVGAACNNAFKKATGKYLSLLDIDDFLMPESIEERVKWLDAHEEYGLVRTNGYTVMEDDVENCSELLETNENMKKKEHIFEELFYGTTYVWPGTYMIRMDVLDRIYPDREIYPSRSGQNLQFLMMAAYYKKSGFIDKPLMKYVVRKESLSHFSSGDVLEKKIKAMYGYKDIRQVLLKKLFEDDLDEWNKKLELLYSKIFMQYALQHNDKSLMRENYKIVKQLRGNDLATKLIYYRMMNPICYVIIRVVMKCKNIRNR